MTKYYDEPSVSGKYYHRHIQSGIDHLYDVIIMYYYHGHVYTSRYNFRKRKPSYTGIIINQN